MAQKFEQHFCTMQHDLFVLLLNELLKIGTKEFI